jgi:aldose 1-epimerase
VAASSILEVGPHQIPTGVFQPVLQTPFDLRAEEGIILGDRIQQIDGGGKPGFDHCFVVDGYDRAASREKSEHVRDAEDEVHEKGSPESWIRARARFMATLVDPKSGRAMDVRGTQPGLQVYTANWLDEEDGQQHAAVCLETEFFPNAVNDPKAGCVDDVILRPGQIYRHFTSHRFYNLPKP